MKLSTIRAATLRFVLFGLRPPQSLDDLVVSIG